MINIYVNRPKDQIYVVLDSDIRVKKDGDYYNVALGTYLWYSIFSYRLFLFIDPEAVDTCGRTRVVSKYYPFNQHEVVTNRNSEKSRLILDCIERIEGYTIDEVIRVSKPLLVTQLLLELGKHD